MAGPMHHYYLIKFTIQTLFSLTGFDSYVQIDDWIKSILGFLSMMTTFRENKLRCPTPPYPYPHSSGREWAVGTIDDFKAALKEGCLWKRRAVSIRRKKTTEKLMQMILFFLIPKRGEVLYFNSGKEPHFFIICYPSKQWVFFFFIFSLLYLNDTVFSLTLFEVGRPLSWKRAAAEVVRVSADKEKGMAIKSGRTCLKRNNFLSFWGLQFQFFV
ncbi:hypothetical protein CEXT_679831 [Caerostris extrusa]|uniref:Uncharacterized protein n=1 Tax=Caerostris extrusa TaxID=172846 RepID=A0AAV4PTE8_CAEEX|nr:hypothetical protein CEXT_679831 [Caerostris extrusa]